MFFGARLARILNNNNNNNINIVHYFGIIIIIIIFIKRIPRALDADCKYSGHSLRIRETLITGRGRCESVRRGNNINIMRRRHVHLNACVNIIIQQCVIVTDLSTASALACPSDRWEFRKSTGDNNK